MYAHCPILDQFFDEWLIILYDVVSKKLQDIATFLCMGQKRISEFSLRYEILSQF